MSRFNKTQARVLVYGPERNHAVYCVNNIQQLEDIITCWGKPVLYMKNFNTWEELERARKSYEWMLSAIPGVNTNTPEPSPEDKEWFWMKQLNDEYLVKSIDEINKWVEYLPDDPDAYSYTKERRFSKC